MANLIEDVDTLKIVGEQAPARPWAVDRGPTEASRRVIGGKDSEALMVTSEKVARMVVLSVDFAERAAPMLEWAYRVLSDTHKSPESGCEGCRVVAAIEQVFQTRRP